MDIAVEKGRRKRYNIAFLLPGFGVVDRGAETFVLELVKRLEMYFDITILCLGTPSQRHIHIRSLSRDQWLVQRLYGNKIIKKVADLLFLDPLNLESLFFTIKALPELLKNNFNLHFPVNGVWGAIACRIIRLFNRTPYITVGQAGIGRPDLWQARQRPNVHIVLTTHAYDWIVTQCPKLSVKKIPNGVDLQRYGCAKKTASREAEGLERPLYLCAAALSPYKNINCTIAAVARLEKGSLIVTGAGASHHEIVKLGTQMLGQKRFLLKAVPHAEMFSYYSACDVFTLVSEKECEAFGIVYLEAMACNKPVVATDDPIRKEIIGAAGIFCDGHNITEYASALQEAASRNFNNTPLQQAEKFSWDSIAMQYQQTLFSLVL